MRIFKVDHRDIFHFVLKIKIMSLSLRYHAKTSVPVEIEGVIPDRVRTQSLTGTEVFAW